MTLALVAVALVATAVVAFWAGGRGHQPRPGPDPLLAALFHAPAPPPPAPVPLLEPWRATHPDAVLVSIELIQTLVIPQDWTRALNDPARVDKIAGLLNRDGCKQPLELVLDLHGRMVLGDGHNRLCAATRLGWAALPVVLTKSPRITGYARPVRPFLLELARSSPPRPASAAPRTSPSATPGSPA